MYLLMLLATFMSAIYGYNLSARPDYDRDVAKKKAASVIYKFTFQHTTLRRLAIRISHSEYKDKKGVAWVLPGDLFYAISNDTSVKDSEDLHTMFNQSGVEALFFLRAKDHKEHDTPDGEDYLGIGRSIYDGSEMASQIICLDKPMNEAGSKFCTAPVDGEGNVTGTCCNGAKGGRYLVSYKRLDARWLNRISGDVSIDFTKALNAKDYYDNIGVVKWKNGAWQFRGKLNFPPVYADDMDKWEEDHKGTKDERYPAELKKRTVWTLPPVFTSDFFKSKGRNGSTKELCKDGCLFRIQAF